MSVLLKILVTVQLLCFSSASLSEEITILKPSAQRIIFETEFGDLVFSLYPEIAPRHVAQVTRLVETGAYDTTHFFRIIPGFILQLSDIYDRRSPLTAEQRDANQRLAPEFSPRHMRHRAGTLSMAREIDDPGSATSSFSILLGNAPHLDGEYTIFGELESGTSVVKKMLAVPRNDEAPTKRLTVNRAYIVDDKAAYYENHPVDPVDKNTTIVSTEEAIATINQGAEERTRLVVIMMIAIIVVSLVGFFLYSRLSKARLLSLLLINVLIAVFLLFVILAPEAHKKSWLAVLIFVGLFSLFRCMSYFESKRD